jgi:hypothetical protein
MVCHIRVFAYPLIQQYLQTVQTDPGSSSTGSQCGHEWGLHPSRGQYPRSAAVRGGTGQARERTYDQACDSNNLDASENEFAFAVNAGAKHVDDDNHDQTNRDPQ